MPYSPVCAFADVHSNVACGFPTLRILSVDDINRFANIANQAFMMTAPGGGRPLEARVGSERGAVWDWLRRLIEQKSRMG